MFPIRHQRRFEIPFDEWESACKQGTCQCRKQGFRVSERHGVLNGKAFFLLLHCWHHHESPGFLTGILLTGGAPEMLSVMLEGESLFNDASSLTLFEIFKEVVLHNEEKASCMVFLGSQCLSITWG
jgi:hypothetical protein